MSRLSRMSPLIAALLLLSLGSCVERRLDYAHIRSPAMGPSSYVRVAVYAPRDLRPDEKLPLVVFLHGGGDGAGSFDVHGIGQQLDQAMAQGSIPRVVVVVPDGGTGFWENWVDGSRMYVDAVVRDVIPAVRERYHTQPCPAGCHVMGVSMGGHGALRFAVVRPGVFSSVSALSTPIFDAAAALEFMENFWIRLIVPVQSIWGDIADRERMARRDLYARWQKQADLGGIRLTLAWAKGDRKGIVKMSRKFHEHLRARGIAHEAFEFEGGHNWVSWGPVIQRVLRTLSPPK